MFIGFKQRFPQRMQTAFLAGKIFGNLLTSSLQLPAKFAFSTNIRLKNLNFIIYISNLFIF